MGHGLASRDVGAGGGGSSVLVPVAADVLLFMAFGSLSPWEPRDYA
jgi:hypothetical protein